MMINKSIMRRMCLVVNLAKTIPIEQKYRLACIIFNGKFPISLGINKVSTHPKAKTKWRKQHAEFNSLINANPDDIKGCVAYVARIGRKSDLRMAKPCCICEDELRNQGIKSVYYTNQNGGIEKLTL